MTVKHAVAIEMEMPNNCGQCPISDFCLLDERLQCNINCMHCPDNGRPDWCPLRPVIYREADRAQLEDAGMD